MAKSNYFKNTKALYGTRNAESSHREVRIGSNVLTLYKRNDIKSPSWYFKMRVKGERQYYKRSLKTEIYKDAEKLAVDQALELLGNIKSGNKITSFTIADIFTKYKHHTQQQLEREEIRPSTLRNWNYRLEIGKRFLASKYNENLRTKIGNIDGSVFDEYLAWREKEMKDKDLKPSLNIIRDELIIIRKCFKWANSLKIAPEKAIPRWIPFKAPELRRERFTRKEYNQFIRILLNWSKQKASPKEMYYRSMVRHGFLIVANCGLRSGELFGLRNKDIIVNEADSEVEITVRAETSKIKQTRDIVLVGITSTSKGEPLMVNYAIRWKKDHQIHQGEKDYFFAQYEQGDRSARENFYHYFSRLREELKKHSLEKFDLYHARHAFITFKLEANQNIYRLAKATGTSLNQIEKTYSHLLSKDASREIQSVRAKWNGDKKEIK